MSPTLRSEPQPTGPLAAPLSPLTKALQFCKDGWLPVSPKALSRIRDGMRSGRYSQDSSALLTDVKADSGLFLTCIRRLRETALMRTELDLADEALSMQLDHLRPEDLQPLVDGPASFLSRHTLGEATPAQEQRLAETVIASTTVRYLSENAELDPTYAECGALLRQLGMTLVAWNYPHVFSRACSQASERSVKESLTRVLGFSPNLLGIMFLRSWNADPALREVLGDVAVAGTLSAAALNRAQTLRKLCDAGEALARASFPALYKGAAVDRELALEAVTESMGRDGLQELLSAISERFEQYSDLLGRRLEVPDVVKAQNAKAPDNSTAAAHRNRYAASCPTNVRAELSDLYALLASPVVSREALDLFIQHIVPDAGFARGVIYLLDPEEMLLEPRLAIKSPIPLLDLPAVKITAHNPSEMAKIFMAAGIEELEGSIFEARPVKALAGALGQTSRSGLLYLELGPQLIREEDSQRRLIFKALRQALSDTLKFE